MTAWEMGYFGSTGVSLEDAARTLDITQQSPSKRLQRGYESLIGDALAVTPPTDEAVLEK